MKLIKLKIADGSWANFSSQWQEQCEKLGEDFTEYEQSSFSILQSECEARQNNNLKGIYALKTGNGTFLAACALNATLQKGYNGRVLRVRHLTLSPYFDFSDLKEDEYSEVFSGCFFEILNLSNGDLKSEHVKIHYKSPYDRTFFSAFASAIKSSHNIKSIESKGMWLYLTKA